MVYFILKRLPKFELVSENIDARVARASFLLDTDVARNQNHQGKRGNNRKNNNHATIGTACQVFASLDYNGGADYHYVSNTLLITLCPSIGKKKAKEIAYYSHSSRSNKHQFNTPTLVESRRIFLNLEQIIQVNLLWENFSRSH